jgi:hypothetical protein
MRCKIFCCLSIFVAFLCGSVRLPAQNAKPSLQKLPLILPIRYENGHIFVDMEDTRFGRLHLLLDTGAERTSLSSSVLVATHLQNSGSGKKYSVIGAGPEKNTLVYRTTHLALSNSNIPLFDVEAVTLPLDEIARALSQPVDGILGWDLISQWCMRINYQNRELTLTESDQCTPPSAPHGTIHGEWSSHGFLIPTTITFANAKPANVLLHLDTGADSSLFLRPKFRKIAGLSSNLHEQTGEHGIGLNGSYISDIVKTQQILIGKGALHFTDGNVFIGHPGSFSKTRWWLNGFAENRLSRDGEIGNAALDQTTVTLDPLRRCMYVELNSNHGLTSTSRP